VHLAFAGLIAFLGALVGLLVVALLLAFLAARVLGLLFAVVLGLALALAALALGADVVGHFQRLVNLAAGGLGGLLLLLEGFLDLALGGLLLLEHAFHGGFALGQLLQQLGVLAQQLGEFFAAFGDLLDLFGALAGGLGRLFGVFLDLLAQALRQIIQLALFHGLAELLDALGDHVGLG